MNYSVCIHSHTGAHAYQDYDRLWQAWAAVIDWIVELLPGFHVAWDEEDTIAIRKVEHGEVLFVIHIHTDLLKEIGNA